MKFTSLKMLQRKLICVVLGVFFGLVCVSLASRGNVGIWGSVLMWSILFNRLLIGIVVFMGGIFTRFPIFKFRIHPWFRGAILGAVVSLDIAIGVFISSGTEESQMKMIFWSTIIAGAIYGMIIDLVATKLAGEGKEVFLIEER